MASRRTERARPRRGWRPGGILLLAGIGVWLYMLRGFTSTSSLIVLGLLGPLAVLAGLHLVAGGARRMFESLRYAAVLLFGLLVVAAGVATLAPVAPDTLLVTTSSGWEILEQRLDRLEAAIRNGDVGLARRLVERGLGGADPRSRSGEPVLHGVENADMLAVLLEGGLDPDARDLEGRTLLMTIDRPEMARLLLAAGADVDAIDRRGLSVADYLRGREPVLRQVEMLIGRSLRAGDDAERMLDGRTEWITVERDPSAALESAVTLEPRPVRRGEVASMRADIGNDSESTELLEVRATLNQAALFVGASHEGAIANPAQPQLVQTIRWPVLALPAWSQGRLELQIVARADARAGDLAVDWHVLRLRSRKSETFGVVESPREEAREIAPAGWSGLHVVLGAVIAAWLWFVVRRRVRARTAAAGSSVRPVGRVVTSIAALVCGGVTVALLWSIVSPLVDFEERTCTILDRRFYLQSSSTATGRSPALPGTRSAGRPTTDAVPIAAVRIDTGAAPVIGAAPLIATGFAVDMTNRSVQELRDFPLGARVPCLVDPDQPSRFALVWHPSLSGVVAIAVLSMLTLVLAVIARGLRSTGERARHR